jgi:L-threonylcarbamoyladenylate synthase
MDNQIKQAIKILNEGGIIIFPTDTAFGIGCRLDNEKAIKKLFEIRKRQENQAMPVLVSSVEMAQKYLLPIPVGVKEKLMDRFWPGGLTIILPCKKDVVPNLVRGGGGTLGVRVPDNKVILRIIESIGVPVLGPSANFGGEKTPYDILDVNKKLIRMVDFVLQGEVKYKVASTVIDCSNDSWAVLREGAIKI